MTVAILRCIRSAFDRCIRRKREWSGIAFVAIETIGNLHKRLSTIDNNEGNSIVQIRAEIGMEILLVFADPKYEMYFLTYYRLKH